PLLLQRIAAPAGSDSSAQSLVAVGPDRDLLAIAGTHRGHQLRRLLAPRPLELIRKILDRGPRAVFVVGQTIAFCGLSSLSSQRLVDRRQKAIVCPTPRSGSSGAGPPPGPCPPGV